MKLLIIEDEDLIRITLERAFQGRGYEVHSASNGESGLQKFNQFQPDLVLLDLLMPIKNGFDFMKEFGGNVPIIVMTAYSGDGFEIYNSEQFPFIIGLLKKPFAQLSELILQIEGTYANYIRTI